MNIEELMRAALAAWNERGIEGFLEFTSPDLVWHAPPEYPEGQEWRGREVLAKAWHEQFDSVFEEVHGDLDGVEVGPKHYFASFHGHARARGSGIQLDWNTYIVGTLQGDLIEEVWLFNHRDEARKQARLEPE